MSQFASKFSLEATKPSEQEIASLVGIVPRGTEIYLSMVPGQTFEQHAAVAALVRHAGFEPVAHLPARRIVSATALDEFLSRLRDAADARRVLAVAGDVESPRGPFHDALALIRSGALQNAGIEEIGIAGYPEGHPKIGDEKIGAALRDKMAAAQETGLRLHIVSQFSFAPDKIVAWLRRLRSQGVTLPVKVGMAGPTSVTALLRYARRCGVGASLGGLMSGAAAGLLGNVGPDKIIEALDAAGGLGDAQPHFFSFGGVVDTARYAKVRSDQAATASAMTASR